MRITFIGYKENSINFFPELGKLLSAKISGVELEERFVPFVEDLPIVAAEASADSDFIFVYALVDESEQVPLIKQKLIDVELASKTRILKLVEDDSFSGLNQDDLFDKKTELSREYAQLIVDILFNEHAFTPKEKELY
ncbi:Uncharacterised protein [uncultured archaeon]|nr:Uncharacterised protein [uncultured archaeon]